MNWRRCYLHSNSTNQTHNQLTSHSTSSYVLVSKMTTVLWTQLHCTMVVICLSFLVLLQSVLRRYVYIRIAFLSSEPTSLQVNDILVSYVVMNIIYEFILLFLNNLLCCTKFVSLEFYWYFLSVSISILSCIQIIIALELRWFVYIKHAVSYNIALE